MRILATGFTSAHTGRQQALNIQGLAPILQNHLKGDCDFTCSVLTPEVYDQLNSYDLVLTGIADISSIFACYSIHTMVVLNECRRRGIPVLAYVDDWQFYKYVKSFQRFGGGIYLDRIMRVMLPIKGSLDVSTNEFIPKIRETIGWLGRGDWPLTLICLFPWGSVEHASSMMGLSADRLVHVDPSSKLQKFDIPQAPDIERERKWILASLFDHSAWTKKLGLQWDVDVYGHRRSHAPRLAETELAKVYGYTWGVLSPYYKPAAVGWWRNRYVYATRAGAILGVDHELMPPGFTAVAPKDIERMSLADLIQYRDTQNKALKFWPEEQFDAVVDGAIKQSMRGW